MVDGKSNQVENIVLIGMPGAGKSTLGVLLAKHLAKSFVDTDIVLQESIGTTLQDFLDQFGYLKLREEEEKMLMSHSFSSSVIATGGSVVYSASGMQKLCSQALTIYLDISYETLLQRVHNQTERGIACPPGTTLQALYHERESLYRQYADKVVTLDDKNLEQGLIHLLACISS